MTLSNPIVTYAVGVVATGCTVAKVRSAGAAGLFAGSIGWVVLATGVSVGAGVGAIKMCNSGMSGGRRFAGVSAAPSLGNWTIGTEEGIANVLLYVFPNEEAAWKAFREIRVARIIYNSDGYEVSFAGFNGWAIGTIRRVIENNSQMERDARKEKDVGYLAGCIIAFKTRHGRYLSAHPNDELRIENHPNSWETFRLYGIKGEPNKYAARSVVHGQRFLQMVNDRWTVGGHHLGENETLTLLETDGDTIFVRGFNRKYISIGEDQNIDAVSVPGNNAHMQLILL